MPEWIANRILEHGAEALDAADAGDIDEANRLTAWVKAIEGEWSRC